jgi:hypothetical protein
MKGQGQYPTPSMTYDLREPTAEDIAIRRMKPPEQRALFQSWRGDDALTRWEEDFLRGMVEKLDMATVARPQFSPRQWATIWGIRAKLESKGDAAAEGDEDGYMD